MPKFRLKDGKKHTWKKAVKRGGSDNVMKDRQLVGGCILECEEHEIKYFRDMYDLVEEEQVVKEPKYGFIVEKIGDQQYDVVSMKTNKRINNDVLNLSNARELAKTGIVEPENDKE